MATGSEMMMTALFKSLGFDPVKFKGEAERFASAFLEIKAKVDVVYSVMQKVHPEHFPAELNTTLIENKEHENG